MADETKTPPPGDTGADPKDTTRDPAHDTAGDDKKGPMIPKARLDQEITKRRGVEEQLEAVAKELEADVPEAFRDLIPASLSAAERVKWLRAATAKGLFTTADPLPTDHSKPKITKPTPSPDTLSSVQKMASGYGAKKG